MNRFPFLSLLFCLFFLSLSLPCRAAIFTGTASSDTGFAFLARFCFDFDPDLNPAGEFSLEIDSDQSDSYKWAIYDDESNSWPYVLSNKNELNCQELSANGPQGPAFGLGGFSKPVTMGTWPSTGNVPVYQKLRPRFWFLALVHCSDQGVALPMNSVPFRAHFLNTQEDAWSREFGSNERGMNSLFLTFSLFYALFISVHLFGTVRLKRELSFVHPVIKLFTAALLIEFVSVIFYASHYLAFGSDGIGAPLLINFGGSFAALSRMLFILVLLLLAHGWTISIDRFEKRKTIAVVVAAFLALQIALLAYEWASFDPELTSVNFIDLVLQLCIIACYLCFAAYFILAISISWRQEKLPAKKTLYARLGSFFSLWMLGPPAVAVTVLLLDDWVRLKIIQSVNLSITALAFAALAFLLWPSRAQEYFRIHIPSEGVELSDFNEGQQPGAQLLLDTSEYHSMS